MDAFALVKNCVCFTDNRMVYKYVRKSTRQSWKEDDMLHAIKEVTSGAICVVRKTIWGSKKYAAPEVKGQEHTGAWCLQRDRIPADGPATKH